MLNVASAGLTREIVRNWDNIIIHVDYHHCIPKVLQLFVSFNIKFFQFKSYYVILM